MKKTGIILAVIVIIFIGLGVSKDFLLKSAVTAGVSQVMGAPVHIDSFALGVFKPAVRIKGLKLYNPRGFPDLALIDIPEISVDYDLPALLKGRLHLPLLVVNLKEMVVIKNQEGKLNVDSLTVAQKQEQPPKETKVKKSGRPSSKPLSMQIDLLTLSIGKVVYKDYSKGGQPAVNAYDIGIKDKAFKNITSAEQLASLVMVEAMGPAAIKGTGIYAAATVLGAGLLPVGVVATVLGKDSSGSEFNVNFDKAYDTALETVRRLGNVSEEDKARGLIKATVKRSDVTVVVVRQADGKARIEVSARKYMLPKPEVASGVLYEISQKLR